MSSGLKIETTYNVELAYRKANLGRRIGAYLLDGVIKGGYALFLSYVFFNMFGSESRTLIIVFIVFLLPLVFYSLLFEIFMNGRTPAKKILDLQVISLDGRPAHVGQYLLRWLFLLIDLQLSSGLVGILSAALSEKGQRVGDMVAGTVVVDLRSNKSMKWSDEIETDYIPMYEEVTQLSSKEIKTIEKVLYSSSANQFELIKSLALKVEEKLYVSRKDSSREFLNRILRDYQYYQIRKSNFDDYSDE